MERLIIILILLQRWSTITPICSAEYQPQIYPKQNLFSVMSCGLSMFCPLCTSRFCYDLRICLFVQCMTAFACWIPHRVQSLYLTLYVLGFFCFFLIVDSSENDMFQLRLVVLCSLCWREYIFIHLLEIIPSDVLSCLRKPEMYNTLLSGSRPSSALEWMQTSEWMQISLINRWSDRTSDRADFWQYR